MESILKQAVSGTIHRKKIVLEDTRSHCLHLLQSRLNLRSSLLASNRWIGGSLLQSQVHHTGGLRIINTNPGIQGRNQGNETDTD